MYYKYNSEMHYLKPYDEIQQITNLNLWGTPQSLIYIFCNPTSLSFWMIVLFIIKIKVRIFSRKLNRRFQKPF